MRTKDELLTELGKAILEASDRTQELALLNIGEALIDIRDILFELDVTIGNVGTTLEDIETKIGR